MVNVMRSASGRFDVVVHGNRGVITTFENLSEKSVSKLGTRYGWKK